MTNLARSACWSRDDSGTVMSYAWYFHVSGKSSIGPKSLKLVFQVLDLRETYRRRVVRQCCSGRCCRAVRWNAKLNHEKEVGHQQTKNLTNIGLDVKTFYVSPSGISARELADVTLFSPLCELQTDNLETYKQDIKYKEASYVYRMKAVNMCYIKTTYKVRQKSTDCL